MNFCISYFCVCVDEFVVWINNRCALDGGRAQAVFDWTTTSREGGLERNF